MRINSIGCAFSPSFSAKKKGTEKLYKDTNDIKTEKAENKKMDLMLTLAILGAASIPAGQIIKQISKIEYIEPSQKEFGYRENALEYAFKKVTYALKEEKPYEYGVMINDKTNEVLGEYKGDASSVSIGSTSMIFYNLLDIPTEKYTTIHGHPETEQDYTSPFSFQDFISLNFQKNESTSIVVTKHGKYFLLKKKEDFKPLNDVTMKSLEKEYDIVWSKRRSNRCITVNGSSGEVVLDYPQVHRFWGKIAQRYNLEYETNYKNGDDEFDKFFFKD